MAFLDQIQFYREKLTTIWAGLDNRRRWIFGGAATGIFALVFSLVFLTAGEGGMVPIQSPVKDLAAARAELIRYGIESDFSKDRSDLMVPRDKRDRAQIILNAARLLPDGLESYSFLGETDFTSTEPQRFERVRTHIEDLLRLTIQSMDGIRAASVRITPSSRQVLFTPGANRNKASVTVDLAGQPRLSADQVMSITNMVSASYPQLAPEDVFVADTSGHPYRYRGDAQTLSDRLDVRRRLEAATEEKASRTLADYDAICSATIDVRVFDEVRSTDLNYQPDGEEPITAYREDSKEDETTTRPKGTAGLRAESQNSNRTASGGGRTTGNRKRVESLERNLVDERFKSELEKMKLVINPQGSSLAISLPESLAEAGAEQDALRTKVRNLAAKATGLLEVNIAVEFTPRRAPEAQVGFLGAVFGDGGLIPSNGRLLGYGVLVGLILLSFWILSGMVKKSAPMPAPALGEPTLSAAVAASGLAEPGGNLEANLVYEKVNELIERNPQAAASLLKRWILLNE